MGLTTCSLSLQQQAPDLLILDEPTDNTGGAEREILTSAINEYKGALIAVSHDQGLLNEIGIKSSIGKGALKALCEIKNITQIGRNMLQYLFMRAGSKAYQRYA